MFKWESKMLKDTIDELKSLLNMDTVYVADLCGVGEVSVLVWCKETTPPQKAKRFDFLLDVIKELQITASDFSAIDILKDGRVVIGDDPEDDETYSMSLLGFVNEFYNDYDLRTQYKLKVAEAVKDYRDWIEGKNEQSIR